MRDYLQKIYSSSQSLISILNDILDFSKMEASRMGIENIPFDLDQLIDNLRNLFEERAKAKHLDFTIGIAKGTPRNLIGDTIRIQQILSNLLGNAIKFTSQGHVALKIGISQIEGSQAKLTFSVEDTGIGIAQDDLGKLFQPFSQVDGTITRRFGGTGLGLAISYKLLQLMGGGFEVTSHPGQGTIFSFDLLFEIAMHNDIRETRHRAKREAGGLERELVQMSHSFKGSRVLVAEDNRTNQQVVKEFLKLSGFEVTIANNGQEVLELMKEQTFDVILMDIHMPEVGGIEATEQIHRQNQYKSLPIIALTAGVTQEERVRCINCGMNDFVTKPINPEELIRVLCHWIMKSKTAPSDMKPEETEKESQQCTLGELSGFDFSNILVMLGGNEKLLTQLLRSFRDDIQPTRVKIEDQINQDHLEAAEDIVHTLKGAAGNLDLTELFDAADALDSILKQSKLCQDTYNNFLRVLRKTENALARLG
jgi:CheY-like chemotaxis protein/HPt (histidine-containing phosphotransfer) domain-containing protein